MEIRPILSTLRRHKTAAALIVIEIALACAIICNALFMVSQRIESLRRPSGIAEHELVQIRIGGIGTQTDADARTREDLAALRSLPGVAGTATINQVPFGNNSWNTGLTKTLDNPDPVYASAAQYMVNEEATRTLGLKLVAGRDFEPGEFWDGSELDKPDAIRGWNGPVLVTQTLAQKMFPDEDPVGQTVYMANFALTIIGVVETLERPNIWGNNGGVSVIFPVRMNFANGGFYLLRVDDPARRAEVLKAAVAALEKIDPNRLMMDQRPYDEIRDRFFASDRDMIGMLLLVCGLLLAVTALGIVGLASFWVQQRTKQIGIRRALGATKGQIVRYFQTENFILASIGIVLGMLGAYGINQFLMNQYEMFRLPLIYLPIGAVALWLLGQIAVFGPARRAASVPPAIATRTA